MILHHNSLYLITKLLIQPINQSEISVRPINQSEHCFYLSTTSWRLCIPSHWAYSGFLTHCMLMYGGTISIWPSCQPIRDQYYIAWTNQSWVYLPDDPGSPSDQCQRIQKIVSCNKASLHDVELSLGYYLTFEPSATNQRSVLFCINQSEISIVMCQPIRSEDYLEPLMSVVTGLYEVRHDVSAGWSYLRQVLIEIVHLELIN